MQLIRPKKLHNRTTCTGFGLFDICIVEALSKTTLLRVLPRLFTGAHIHHPAVRIERSSWLRIEPREPQLVHVDGESAGYTPAAIECVPGALSMVVPG